MNPDLWIDSLTSGTRMGAEVSPVFLDTFAHSREALATVSRAGATSGLRIWLHLDSRTQPAGKFWLTATAAGRDAQYALRRLAAEMAEADNRLGESPAILRVKREGPEEWRIVCASIELADEVRRGSGAVWIFQTERDALEMLNRLEFYALPEPGQVEAESEAESE